MHLSRSSHPLRQKRHTGSAKCSFNRGGDSEGHFVNALQPSTCSGQVPIKIYKLLRPEWSLASLKFFAGTGRQGRPRVLDGARKRVIGSDSVKLTLLAQVSRRKRYRRAHSNHFVSVWQVHGCLSLYTYCTLSKLVLV